MKAWKFILLAVIGGIVALAVVGAFIQNNEQNGSAPSKALDAPDSGPSEALSPKQQDAYDYIAKHLPELQDFGERLAEHKGYAGLQVMIDEWNEIRDEWQALPTAGGKTYDLELAYENAGNAVFQLVKDFDNIYNGKFPSDAKLEAHVAKAVTCLQTCQDELNAIQSSY